MLMVHANNIQFHFKYNLQSLLRNLYIRELHHQNIVRWKFHRIKFYFTFMLSLLKIVLFDRYQAMESCPRVDIPNFKELLIEENLYLTTEVTKLVKLLWYLNPTKLWWIK